jgi:predicted secreted hydrolase
VLPQGDAGFSRKGPQAGHASYYYSEPQLRVRATSSPPAGKQAVTGTAWLDHEWSSQVLETNAAGWDWTGINLDDGGALMAFQIRGKDGSTLWAHATCATAPAGHPIRTGPGKLRAASDLDLAAHRRQLSGGDTMTTGATQWQLEPLQPDQELDSRRSTGAVYWEGAVTCSATAGRLGRGYLELTGYVGR